MFHVRWLQTALNELTTLWTQANSEVRKEITAAAHELDQALAANHGPATSASRLCTPWPFGFRLKPMTERSPCYTSAPSIGPIPKLRMAQ